MLSHFDENWILYDGDCPFCSNYVRFNRLKENIGPVKLINARQGGAEVEFCKLKNLSLDEGMAFYYKKKLYHGEECVHLLTLLSSKSSIFGLTTSWVFGSKKRAKFFYPILKAGRNLTLILLGKGQIEQTKE